VTPLTPTPDRGRCPAPPPPERPHFFPECAGSLTGSRTRSFLSPARHTHKKAARRRLLSSRASRLPRAIRRR
jgi:hypothetical protein